MTRPRMAVGGMVYHVLNRTYGGRTVFDADEDFRAFERVLAEAHERVSMRTLAYCIMPDHWHLVLWPREDGDLTRFMGWVTLTHTQREHARRGTVGSGNIYQGRFKTFPVQTDDHLLEVCRYVERNPLRARLVVRAEHWRWCSLWRRLFGADDYEVPLHDGPVAFPDRWRERVNKPESMAELDALRLSVNRGRPFGDDAWVGLTAQKLRLEGTLRGRGRPRKQPVPPPYQTVTTEGYGRTTHLRRSPGYSVN